MRKLLLTTAVIAAITGSVFACSKHTEALSALLSKNMSWGDVSKGLADVVKDLETGETVACSQLGADGKYTRIYSSVAGAKANEVLAGDAEKNTEMMFKAVEGKKTGEAVDITFTSSDGKNTPMKGSAMSAGGRIVCAVMWPAAEDKKEEAKPANGEAAGTPVVEPKKEDKTTAAPAQPLASPVQPAANK